MAPAGWSAVLYHRARLRLSGAATKSGVGSGCCAQHGGLHSHEIQPEGAALGLAGAQGPAPHATWPAPAYTSTALCSSPCSPIFSATNSLLSVCLSGFVHLHVWGVSVFFLCACWALLTRLIPCLSQCIISPVICFERVSVCLAACVSACLSVCLLVCLPVCLCVCLCPVVQVSVCSDVCLPRCLSYPASKPRVHLCKQGLGISCMYCGDGINDLEALAAADVGMAVGAADASAAATFSDKHYSVAGQLPSMTFQMSAEVLVIPQSIFLHHQDSKMFGQRMKHLQDGSCPVALACSKGRSIAHLLHYMQCLC